MDEMKDEAKNCSPTKEKMRCERTKKLFVTALGAFLGAFLGSYFIVNQFLVKECPHKPMLKKCPPPCCPCCMGHHFMQDEAGDFYRIQKHVKNLKKPYIYVIMQDEETETFPFDRPFDPARIKDGAKRIR